MPRNRNAFGRSWAALKNVALGVITLGAMAWSRTGSGGWGRRSLMPGSHYDYEKEAGDLWTNSAVAACLRVLRVNFGEPFLEVAEGPEPDAKAVARHAMAELIRRPNGSYSQSALWSATILSLKVDGNAYWLKVRALSGAVAQLWWAPHWMVKPVRPNDGRQFISHYEYSVNGQTWRLPASEVIHFRQGLDPHDDTRGLADLKAACREITGDNQAATYSCGILRNSGVPTVVITPDDGDGGHARFGDGEADSVRQDWRTRFTGENAGDPLVTDSVKVQKIGYSPKEMTLGDLPDRFEDRMAACLGVNPMVAGLTSGATHKTFANYSEARRALYEDTIIPDQKSVAEELTEQLLRCDFEPDTGRRVARWVYKGVQCLQENMNEVADRIGKLYHDSECIDRAEARGALGYLVRPEDVGHYFSDGAAKALENKDDAPEDGAALEVDATTGQGPQGRPASAAIVPADDVQAAALNGAQIASMVEVVTNVVNGTLPAEAALAILAAAFPALPPEAIAGILSPLEGFEPATPDVGQGGTLPGNPGESGPPDPEDAATKALTREVLRLARDAFQGVGA